MFSRRSSGERRVESNQEKGMGLGSRRRGGAVALSMARRVTIATSFWGEVLGVWRFGGRCGRERRFSAEAEEGDGGVGAGADGGVLFDVDEEGDDGVAEVGEDGDDAVVGEGGVEGVGEELEAGSAEVEEGL